MKAVIYKNYGAPNVLAMAELPIPIPQANQLLVQVNNTCVTAADLMMRTGKPYIGRLYTGLTKPKRQVLGFEFAGIIEAIGENVDQFNVGDKVFGGTTKLGGYAEYICIDQDALVTKQSDNMTDSQVAPLSGSGITALNFLKLGGIKQGQNVLIYGASGGVGCYAVSIAKALGARVTAVCGERNFELVKGLGADELIDYKSQDFTKTGNVYDVIFDTVGKISFSNSKNSLSKNGTYLSVVLNFTDILHMLRTSIFNRKSGQKVKLSATGMLPLAKSRDYLLQLKSLMQAQKITSIIDRNFALDQVSLAHEYVATGHKVGNLIISI